MSTCGSTAHMRNQTSYRSQQNRSAYRLVRTAAFADSLAALKVQEVVPTADTVMPVDNSKPSVLSMIANPGKLLKDNFEFGYHIMKVIFDPFVLPFTCYRQGDNAQQSYDVDEYHECCISVKWAPAFFIEMCVIISALVLYVMGFVWILSIEEGVHACMMGGMLPPTDPTGLSSPLKYYSNCSSSACTVTTAVGNMGLPTYIDLRLAMYLISAVPSIYLIFMVALHIQQKANAEFTVEKHKEALEKWHMLWLGIMTCVEIVAGLALFVLDIGATTSIGDGWGTNTTCYRAEQEMLKYSSGARISIKDLPIALAILSVPYMLWYILFLVNEVSKFLR